MTRENHHCRSCARGWPNGNAIACGAAVEDQPIWAERKYGRESVIAMLVTGQLPEGSDCDRMAPDDGADCQAWMQPAPKVTEPSDG